MVRKKGKDIWTNLGGKPEGNETEQEALLREIKEEINCGAKVIKKIGDFTAKAVFDDALVKISAYLVEIKGTPVITDDELKEVKFISKNYKQLGIKLPPSVEEQILPALIQNKLLDW